ncbi:MAG: Mpo1-like protein [Myxococcota bacterium]|nr:Mpo1-like protein [Myxococcota bacterium]
MRRSVEEWLDAYGESHQNPVNKRIHWVCVPLIMLSLLALLAELSAPAWVNETIPSALKPFSHGGTLFLLVALAYYFTLSRTLTLGMLLVSLLLLLGVETLVVIPLPRWQSALLIFVIAWIGQFWGHHIEGKKPSFLEDIQFLLIGPLWLLSFIYRRLGLAL